MQNYLPEWWITSELADAVRRARQAMVEAQETRRSSVACRQRAAVLREESRNLRTAIRSRTFGPRGTRP
jgi:hypothetical protein